MTVLLTRTIVHAHAHMHAHEHTNMDAHEELHMHYFVSQSRAKNINFDINKTPITTAADDTHKHFFIVFQRK